jgi:hypothetical protein
MSSKLNIDLLNRESLVNLGIKLQIYGHTNSFNSPYLKKEELKARILKFFREHKKRIRSNSVSNNSVSNTINSSNSMTRSRSLPNLNSNSNSNSNLNLSNTNSIGSNNDIFNISCIFPKVNKLVAIGDIHGDLSVAIKALKLGGVISMNIDDNLKDISKINWTGGNTYVVQLGDQIDRVRPETYFNNLCVEENSIVEDEGSDLKIIYLFERLHSQALQHGGALISILGNHELMNVDKDFRYVSPKEFREFGNYFKGKLEFNSNVPYGHKERLEAFKPGGILSKRLALTRFSIVQVGSWLFVHGGLTPQCANDYSLDDINYYVRKWLYGDESYETMKHINKLYHNDDDEYSPFWSRTFSDMEEWNDHRCLNEFKKTLHYVNIKNSRQNNNIIKGMVMGHSPQFMYNKSINSSANNRLWRVDVGASRAFGEVNDNNRLVQVLVINNDNEFSILREKRN